LVFITGAAWFSSLKSSLAAVVALEGGVLLCVFFTKAFEECSDASVLL
jgi:hypothetical protein